MLEVGAGTGYNAALLAALGAAVTTVELQPEVAAAAAVHLRATGVGVGATAASGGDGAVAPGSVRVVTGDGAAPPGGPYDRVIVTAGCWSLPAALVDALADGGILVAPLRVNGVELVARAAPRGRRAARRGRHPVRLHAAARRRRAAVALAARRAAASRPRTPTSASRAAARSTGCSRRPAATVGDPLELRDGEHALDALLWLGLQGDPLISLVHPSEEGRPGVDRRARRAARRRCS